MLCHQHRMRMFFNRLIRRIVNDIELIWNVFHILFISLLDSYNKTIKKDDESSRYSFREQVRI